MLDLATIMNVYVILLYLFKQLPKNTKCASLRAVFVWSDAIVQGSSKMTLTELHCTDFTVYYRIGKILLKNRPFIYSLLTNFFCSVHRIGRKPFNFVLII